MIYPSRIHLILAGLLLSVGLLYWFLPLAAISNLWLALLLVITGLLFYDGWHSLKRPALEVERKVHGNLPVTAWSKVGLVVSNREPSSLTLRLHDHFDPCMKSKGQPNLFTLRPDQRATLQYEVFPTKRGHYVFAGTDILVSSPLRLWWKKWFFEAPSEVMVFPNFKEIAHFTLLATHHQLSMMGIKKLLKRGDGNEFHQLREYRQGDELQKIDWKATSRYRRLIAKDYQDQRDQQIIFILDSGRRMRHSENGKSLLDQALNSILLLAYVASRQGDEVGIYSFGGTEKWLPPRKQHDSVRSLLLGMYDIETSLQAADYLRAAEDLLTLQKRRSLMVIITNSRAEDHEDLMKMTRQLCTRHLVVIADLREQILDDCQLHQINGLAEALRYQALLSYLEERRKLFIKLNHLGVLSLDITARQLPAALVNTYLDIKGSSRL